MRFDPQGPFKRDPLAPHQMQDRLTRTEDVFVQCHLGVPRIELDRWSLTIDGMVERPRTLRFDDLMRYPTTELTSVHQCCGSSFAPFEPTRRVCNVRWGGVRLVVCWPIPGQAPLLSTFGLTAPILVNLAAMPSMPTSRIFRSRALSTIVLIAYEINGSALPAENGFPVRLVVPGFYGTNSVKWLTRITLAERRAPGPFTTRWYNDPVMDGTGETGKTTPVWSIAPESVIVSPKPHETIELSAKREISGWAWVDRMVRSVHVRVDAATWRPAELEPPRGRGWRRFWMPWTPMRRGAIAMASRAEAVDGLIQPISGRRNAIHDVTVNII